MFSSFLVFITCTADLLPFTSQLFPFRVVMAAAAAASSSSRATKGLFLLFTLLSLICFANSLLDKNEVEQLKETLEKLQKQSDRLKEDLAEMPITLEPFDDSINILDQLMTYMKETGTFGDDFPPMGTYLEKVNGFMKETKALMKETKAFVDRNNEKLVGQMQENENKLEKLKNMVQFLEESQAELSDCMLTLPVDLQEQLKEKLEKVQKQSDRLKEDKTKLPHLSALNAESEIQDKMIEYMKRGKPD
ncbi:hypothetical protein INR49_011690, partial [Caranx melampygus]